MMSFTQCPVCARHVRVTEQRCVFCSHLLAGGLCLALALSVGCKGQEANTVAPPGSGSIVDSATPLPPEAAAASSPESPVAAPSASAEQQQPQAADSIGLGNIGSIGVYGPPPQSDDAGAPKTRMVLGVAAFTGPVVPGADDVLRAAFPDLRRCYLREVKRKPVSGNVVVTIQLSKTGEITSVDTRKTGGLSESVRTCMAARLSTLKFQAPEGGEPSAVRTTVTCEVQSP